MTAKEIHEATTAAPQTPDSIEPTTAQTLDNETTTQPEEESLTQVVKKKKRRKRWIIILIVILVLLALIAAPFVVFGLHTLNTARVLRSQALTAQVTAQGAADQLKAQNIPAAQAALNDLSNQVEDIKGTYAQLETYRKIPYAKEYYEDGEHLLAAAQAAVAAGQQVITTVTPYSDVLGFAGEGTFTGGTAEDRVRIILETIEKVSPELDSIEQHLNTIETELAQVDPSMYPDEIEGVPIKKYLVEAKTGLSDVQQLFAEFRPVIEQLPSVAGSGERKQYLVLFQNDNELRPSGGFMTAYAIVNIEDGKVQPEKSDDIYELDQKFNKRIPIPESLGRYLTSERYWNLRDMNISPDFRISMEQFYSQYQTVPGEPDGIDGIIAIDTHFLVKLMNILGPTEVPGYGTFSAEIIPECDCPEIIYTLSEIITKPTPYLRDDRKGILGPMMSALLNKAYSAEEDVWPALFAAGFESIERRHIQMYFLDEDSQRAAELANAAGRMQITDPEADFIGIVNANLAGAKSNLFTQYEVRQEVSAPVDGRVTKNVEITYKNTQEADNCNLEAGQLCLNATLRDWTRLYLPQGSELISAEGLTEEAKVYDEEGFTVIDGFFVLEPLGVAKLRFSYSVPYANQDTYNLEIWKQGGIETYPLLMDVTGGQEELVIETDTLYSTPF